MWYTHTYIHTMEYYLAIKNWNSAICNNMDGLWELNVKWKRKTNTVWYHLYVEFEKYNKRVNVTENKIDSYWEQTSG